MDKSNIELIQYQAERQLDNQVRILESYNTKSTILIAVAGLILSLVPKEPRIIDISIQIGKHFDLSFPLNSNVPGLIILFLGFIFTFLSFKMLYIFYPPAIGSLEKYYLLKEKEFTQRRLIKIFSRSYVKNDKIIQKRAKYFRFAFYLLLLTSTYFLVIKIFTR